MNTTIGVPLRKLDNQITLDVKITVTKEFKLRMWIGTQLFRLGAKVMGCGIKGEVTNLS